MNFSLLLFAAAWARADTIQCRSIRDVTGTAVSTGKVTFEHRVGGQGKFSDDRFTYLFELSELGLYVYFRELQSRKEVIVKTNFQESNPYFDVILPVPSGKDKPGTIDMEVECKALKR